MSLSSLKDSYLPIYRVQSRFRDNLQERIALKVMKPKQCEIQGSESDVRCQCQNV